MEDVDKVVDTIQDLLAINGHTRLMMASECDDVRCTSVACDYCPISASNGGLITQVIVDLNNRRNATKGASPEE